MELEEPEFVYTAANNIEANHLIELLRLDGIPAHLIEDHSTEGIYGVGGTPTQILKPKIYVEKMLAKKAFLVIENYEDKIRTNYQAEKEAEGPIEVQCEECGETSVFAKELNGTTQECNKCKAYVDVGDLPWEEDWGEPED